MADARDRTYAELIVNDCLRVQRAGRCSSAVTHRPGPCWRSCARRSARLGAYALLRVSFEGLLPQSLRWVEEVPMEVLATAGATAVQPRAPRRPMRSSSSRLPTTRVPPPALETARGRAPCRLAYRPDMRRAVMNHDDAPWVVCQYPTAALAQEAGLGTDAFAELPLRRRASRLGGRGRAGCAVSRRTSTHAASEVRIVGVGHRSAALARGAEDEGRRARRQPARAAASAARSRTQPRVRSRSRSSGAVYTRSGGRGNPPPVRAGVVVDASAEVEEDGLLSTIDSSQGARRLGELGPHLISGHHPPHEEHAARQEDQRHDPPRPRQLATPSCSSVDE